MPRKIKELIYYDRKRIFFGSWPINVCRKVFGLKKTSGLPSRRKFIVRPLAVYRAALDAERAQYLSDFDKKIRPDSETNTDKIDYRSIRSVLLSENIDRQNRSEAAKKTYYQHLKKQKYG